MRYHVFQFLDKMDNVKFLDPNLPKNGFWGQNLKNLSLDSELACLRYYVHQFLDKMDNFEFLGPNLLKNGFWGQNFKYLSLDLKLPSWDTMCTNFQTKQKTLNLLVQICPKMDFQKSKSGFGINTSKIPCVPIFTQNGQLLIF